MRLTSTVKYKIKLYKEYTDVKSPNGARWLSCVGSAKLGKISHVLPRTNSGTKKPYKKRQKITQEGWHVLVKDYLLGKSVNIPTYPETTERQTKVLKTGS